MDPEESVDNDTDDDIYLLRSGQNQANGNVGAAIHLEPKSETRHNRHSTGQEHIQQKVKNQDSPGKYAKSDQITDSRKEVVRQSSSSTAHNGKITKKKDGMKSEGPSNVTSPDNDAFEQRHLTSMPSTEPIYNPGQANNSEIISDEKRNNDDIRNLVQCVERLLMGENVLESQENRRQIENIISNIRSSRHLDCQAADAKACQKEIAERDTNPKQKSGSVRPVPTTDAITEDHHHAAKRLEKSSSSVPKSTPQGVHRTPIQKSNIKSGTYNKGPPPRYIRRQPTRVERSISEPRINQAEKKFPRANARRSTDAAVLRNDKTHIQKVTKCKIPQTSAAGSAKQANVIDNTSQHRDSQASGGLRKVNNINVDHIDIQDPSPLASDISREVDSNRRLHEESADIRTDEDRHLGQWQCQHCTSWNPIDIHSCALCYKTNEHLYELFKMEKQKNKTNKTAAIEHIHTRTPMAQTKCERLARGQSSLELDSISKNETDGQKPADKTNDRVYEHNVDENWQCRYCTSWNPNARHICETCYKTNETLYHHAENEERDDADGDNAAYRDLPQVDCTKNQQTIEHRGMYEEARGSYSENESSISSDSTEMQNSLQESQADNMNHHYQQDDHSHFYDGNYNDGRPDTCSPKSEILLQVELNELEKVCYRRLLAEGKVENNTMAKIAAKLIGMGNDEKTAVDFCKSYSGPSNFEWFDVGTT